jgi:hypothetical protein
MRTAQMIQNLERQRREAQEKLSSIEKAIEALTALDGSSRRGRAGTKQSPAARLRISRAMRARWRKKKAEYRAKQKAK